MQSGCDYLLIHCEKLVNTRSDFERTNENGCDKAQPLESLGSEVIVSRTQKIKYITMGTLRVC